MREYYTKRPLNRPPIYPGEILREDVLPTLGLSVSEAARRPNLIYLYLSVKICEDPCPIFGFWCIWDRCW